MSRLSNCSELISIFNFDLNMIYLSNNFFELVSDKKNIRNIYEIKLYGHYNMGILAAGMIDLMGIKNINYEELGKCREVFIIAQRISKIANIIATFPREQNEGDITNEIMFLSNINKINLYVNKLEKEFLNGIKKIKKSKNKIKNFNVLQYANGIEELFNLHMSLIGVI